MNKAILPFALIHRVWPCNLSQTRQYSLKYQLEEDKNRNKLAMYYAIVSRNTKCRYLRTF